ncbi:MAG TPA: PEP-CTERM sorting domain-containing protein [Vicinamibacterales bacterium]|nr:PEP-CTERM sorting domain-containing protein [Vicinamibacterales bacterium]
MVPRIRTVLPIFAILLAGSVASADPLGITGGRLRPHYRGDLVVEPTAIMESSALRLVISSDDYTQEGPCFSTRCAPGSMVDVSRGFSSLQTHQFVYGGVDRTGERVTFGAQVNAAPLTLPRVGERARLQGPFVMNGVLDFRGGTHTLVGAGTAYAWFEMEDSDERHWSMTGLTFQFEEPAPVPEPSTVLLLAGGLAVAIRRARRSFIPS